jgi:hypothetical protein
VEAACGDQSLSSSQIYRIIKQARAGKNTDNQHHLNPKKTVHPATLITSVAAAVANDRLNGTQSLAADHGVCLRTICQIFKEDLGLEKKSECWLPKLLSEKHKKERMRISKEFVATIQRCGLSMLDNIVTMDETMVSYYAPDTQKMSKDWTLKGKPGPLKAKVQASRSSKWSLSSLILAASSTRISHSGAPPSIGSTSWMSWASSGRTCC